MFRVSNIIEETKTKNKKLMFISTMSSNETSSFNDPKPFENSKKESHTTSKSSSLSTPLPPQKYKSKFFGNSKNSSSHHNNIPMKRILFRLYRVNYNNQRKEKNKNSTINKKENGAPKKNMNYIFKHKQKNLATKNNNITYNNKNYTSGRWKSDEHQRFIDAIIKYGNNWRQVQKCVGTRSSTQTRSHAQKFFEKLKRSKIFKHHKYDFSKNSLKILHDIMENLPLKEYNETLKALHSLSYERNQSSKNELNIIQNNNNEADNLNDNLNENNENNAENGNYEAYDINHEDNLKGLKFNNQGYWFMDNCNNRLYNNDDYLFCNNSNNYNISNINNIYNCNVNNFLNCDYLNYLDIKSRKESDFCSQRKNSLSELNLNVKELKDQNNNVEDLNFDINFNLANNNFNLNIQQDNKTNNNKIFDFNEDKIGLTKQFNNSDFLVNLQTSRKMSLEEKIN
jgi:SHAQKYF class myb-like DNA-binding protein